MPVDAADESLGRLLQPPEMRLKALGRCVTLMLQPLMVLVPSRVPSTTTRYTAL